MKFIVAIGLGMITSLNGTANAAGFDPWNNRAVSAIEAPTPSTTSVSIGFAPWNTRENLQDENRTPNAQVGISSVEFRPWSGYSEDRVAG